jgi:hypothetical protein
MAKGKTSSPYVVCAALRTAQGIDIIDHGQETRPRLAAFARVYCMNLGWLPRGRRLYGLPTVPVLGGTRGQGGTVFPGPAAARGIQAVTAKQMPAARGDVECQLGDEVQTGEIALLALEVSPGSRTCAHPRHRCVCRCRWRILSGATSAAFGRSSDSAGLRVLQRPGSVAETASGGTLAAVDGSPAGRSARRVTRQSNPQMKECTEMICCFGDRISHFEQGLMLQRRWDTPQDVGRAVAMLRRPPALRVPTRGARALLRS